MIVLIDNYDSFTYNLVQRLGELDANVALTVFRNDKITAFNVYYSARDPHLAQQVTILGVAILTSKGASGVQGAAFIALVGTLMVIPGIPVAGMALILGIDRFMSMFRALINMIGNGVATLVVARWENELDRETLHRNLA